MAYTLFFAVVVNGGVVGLFLVLSTISTYSPRCVRPPRICLGVGVTLLGTRQPYFAARPMYIGATCEVPRRSTRRSPAKSFCCPCPSACSLFVDVCPRQSTLRVLSPFGFSAHVWHSVCALPLFSNREIRNPWLWRGCLNGGEGCVGRCSHPCLALVFLVPFTPNRC